MRWLAGVLGLSVTMAFLACVGADSDTIIVNNNNNQDGAAPAAEGGTITEPDSSTPTNDAGTVPGNLLKNADFEEGCRSVWQGNGATLDDYNDIPQSGAKACRVCSPEVGSWAIFQDVTEFSPGVYDVRGFIRAVNFNDAGVVSNGNLEADVKDQGDTQVKIATDSDTFEAAKWTEVTTVLTVPPDMKTVTVAAVFDDPGCILVDNFSLVKRP